MSDILSGGAIDETTSGPIPASQDNRSLDIIAETAAIQEREAIGGSQNPPTVEPPTPVPQPPEVSPPPLPNIDVPQLGIDFGSAAEATREIARQTTVDVLKRVTIDGQGPVIEGSAISFNTERRSTASEDFGTGGNVNFLQPAFSQGRLEAADFGSRAAMEDRSSANAYAAAEARRDERRMEDPSFDRESPERQRGESRREFRERQEQLQGGRSGESGQVKTAQRERDGDISELPSGMVPVKLTRADGQKTILALMATELVGVVEGATSGERTLTLPPEDSYYEGGGGGGTTPAHPWKITIRTIPESDPPEYEYAIESASRLFNGFGGTPVTVIGADGVFQILEEGYVFIEVDFTDGVIDEARITIDEDIGDIVETSGDPPQQTKLRQQIGYVFFEDDVPKVRQNAWHNYTLFDACRNGVPVKVTIAT
jgi:hypothetical protein